MPPPFLFPASLPPSLSLIHTHTHMHMRTLLAAEEKLRMELTSYAANLWSKELVVAVVVAVLAAPPLLSIFLRMCWTPLRIKRAFQAQGIPTLPFHLFCGNLPEIAAIERAALSCPPLPHVSHDIAPRALPSHFYWAQKYGVPYVHWFGWQARYSVINAEDAKDILSTKFRWYWKPPLPPALDELFHNGLVHLDGEKWAQHRRILNPAFFLDRLKAMIPAMEACTTAMMESWGSLIESGQAIDAHTSMKDLTVDIIAHTAFGSIFAEGKQVFELQREQQVMMEKLAKSAYLRGSRFLPTAFNWHCWRIKSDIRRGFRQVINHRLEEYTKFSHQESYGNDVLGIMLAANKHDLPGNHKNLTMSVDDIIDECRTFFFAGHETTASFLTWTFLLLATNPEWQTRTREEVIAACGMTDTPTAEIANRLKIMGMVLNEALRLYPPVATIFREASTDMQLGKVTIPKGTLLQLPIVMWHHDKRYWGADADEFRPKRFSEGIAKAGKAAGAASAMLMPFSMGPRVCIGQSFALLEAKVVLSTILRHYRFRLSPSYKHAPTIVLTLQPQFGMPLLFEKL